MVFRPGKAIRFLKAILFITFLMKLSVQQPILPASPTSFTSYIQETNELIFDGDANSFNGAACVSSVTVDASSPNNPSWLSNDKFNFTVLPTLLADRGTYTIKVRVEETGVGTCNMVPHFREFALVVTKRGPSINYVIPDQNDLRAGVPYDIVLPQPVCEDPLGEPLNYSGLSSTGSSLPSYINLDLNNNRIYGYASTSDFGSITLRVVCVDIFAQSKSQLFTMVFNKNHDPVQTITDLAPYKVKVAEGMNSTYVLPEGIYTDLDNDKIYYQLCYFKNYSTIDTPWAYFNLGYEGEANITFTDVPASLSTNSHFIVIASDNIGSTLPPIEIPMELNLRPIRSTPIITLNLYPNDTFTHDFSTSTLFTDPEADPLTFTLTPTPTSTFTSPTPGTHRLELDPSTITTTTPLSLTADDTYSLPNSISVQLVPQGCHGDCTKCYGGSDTECYECAPGKFLLGSTCVSTCPDDKFELNGVCEGCHPYCKECSGPGNANCQICESGYFRHGSTCDSSCPIEFFKFTDPVDPECIACATGCRECTGELASECVVCMPNHAWNPTDNRCIEIECLDDEYINLGACHKCDDACNGCSAGSNLNCNACAQGYLDQSGTCTACALITGKMLDEFNNCIDIPPPTSPSINEVPLTCDFTMVTLVKIDIRCSEKVSFLKKDPSLLFKFEITGEREVYKNKIKMITDLNVNTQKVEFSFLPESTYIGLNQEVMKLTFLDRNLIVSESNSSKTLSNKYSTIELEFRTDAIPENVDTISKTIGMVIGLGFLASILFDVVSKVLFGFYSTMGGYIDFVQIVSFMPLFDLYFPGNVRSFASVLKYANVVGQGFFNPFYYVIDKTNIKDEPYNYRFSVMGIESRIFITNLGFQITIIFIFSLCSLVVRYIVTRCFTDAEGRPRNREGSVGWIYKILTAMFNFNSILRTIVILSMFSFLSSLTTIIDLNFETIDELFSFLVGLVACLFLICFSIGMGYYIQKNRGNFHFSQKYSHLFDHLKENIVSKYYIPFSMGRKGLYVIAIILYTYDCRYLVFFPMVFIQLAYLIFICIVRPYDSFSFNLKLIMNEVSILGILLFSIVFIPRKMNNDDAILLGWLWISLCSLTVFMNWGHTVVMVLMSKLCKAKLENRVDASTEKDRNEIQGNEEMKNQLSSSGKFNPTVRSQSRKSPGSKKKDPENQIDYYGDDIFNIQGREEFKAGDTNIFNIKNNYIMKDVSGNPIINVGEKNTGRTNLGRKATMGSDISGRKNSDDSEYFGYNDRPSNISSKNILRKLSDPKKIQVRSVSRKGSSDSDNNMLYNQDRNLNDSSREESKDIYEGRSRFHSDDRNISTDSSRAIKAHEGDNLYGSNKLVWKAQELAKDL